MPDPNNSIPTGGNDLGTALASIYDLIRGTTGGSTSDANHVADIADPWRGKRSQFQDQLVGFMADPSAIFKDPAYTAARDQGLEAINRSAGASGMAASGNRLTSLMSFGDTFAQKAYDDKFAQLKDLAGVDAGSPAAAATAIQTGQQNRDSSIGGGIQGVSQLISSLMNSGLGGSALNAIKGLFGAGGGGGDVTGSTDDFLRQLGIDPSTVDPQTLQELQGVLGDPTGALDTLGQGGNLVDPGSLFGVGSGIDPSTAGIINDSGIFDNIGSLFGGP